MHSPSFSQKKVPILTYHSIDDRGTILSMPPEKFLYQMQVIKDRSFNTISLEQLITCIRENQPFPDKSVAITFDDGFKNIYQTAYPILKKFGLKATVFLVPGCVSRSSEWNAHVEGLRSIDLINWDEAKEMSENNIDFGSHTVHHRDLSKVPLSMAREEIIKSRLIIQQHIGKDVPFFAYPYGSFNQEVRTIVEQTYKAALTTTLGFVDRKSSLFALPRIDMYYFSKNNFFKLIGTSFFSLYVYLRRFPRLIRTSLMSSRGTNKFQAAMH